jgi:hypothetical protein
MNKRLEYPVLFGEFGMIPEILEEANKHFIPILLLKPEFGTRNTAFPY